MSAKQLGQISIHAPREGSDVQDYHKRLRAAQISIHAPREGSDALPIVQTLFGNKFLSTLPARGATGLNKEFVNMSLISIHAPREGSDRPEQP